jgi:uncharacterized protein YecE (DUF72 family)
MTAPRIGTCGWSYPSGAGSWNGIFYPATGARAEGRRGRFDELAYYAEHFDTVEVNSTFYRLPSPVASRSWVRRTPPDFSFSVKLFQQFTHPAMFARAVGAPRHPNLGDVDAFKAAIDPLVSGGKLGALLAQFPASFTCGDRSRAHLSWLLGAFAGYPTAVELRHRTWSDDRVGTQALLESLGAAWVHIDEPKFDSSIRQTGEPSTGGLHYVRLHGRNAEAWWSHDRAEDRYDYLYDGAELAPIGRSVTSASRRVGRAYLYFNNHFAAKAVVNAVQLTHLLHLPVRGIYADAFVARYPEIEGLVVTASPRLPLRSYS